MENTAYITIEDNLGTSNLPEILELALNELGESSYIRVMFREKYSEYCVLKVECDDWHDAIDLCSALTSILIKEGVYSFLLTYRDDRLTHE